MKFSSKTVSLLALCFLGSLVVNCFCELTVLREPPRKEGDPYKFTCISRDDRSALVWNDDLRAPLGQRYQLTPFTKPKIKPRCAVVDEWGCHSYWRETDDWELVNSVDNPMGPVFDSRWEDFDEISFPSGEHELNDIQYVKQVPRSGAVVFSARGFGDVILRLCQENLPSDPACFTITIAASPNRTSEIRSDSEGVTDSGYKAPNQSIIDAHEWRTFTVEWVEGLRTVRVYSDAGFHYRKEFRTWINVKHLFIESDDVGRVRFHFYDYFLTKTANTVLKTRKLFSSAYTYCLELLVGLCTECQLEIFGNMYSTRRFQRVGNISGSGSNQGNLPLWQIARIISPSPYSRIKLVSKRKRKFVSGFWAVKTFRRCKSLSDDVRTLLIVPGSPTSASSPYPMVGCQRLKYGSHAVVIPGVTATENALKNTSKCDRGWFGPSCSIQCNHTCIGVFICQSSGCSCAPGFNGSNCQELSDTTFQGTCGFCKSGLCSGHGVCDGDCVDYYLPPSCKTKLDAPRVLRKTATTALIEIPTQQLTGPFANEICYIVVRMKSQQGGARFDEIKIVINYFPDPSDNAMPYIMTQLSPDTLYTVSAIASRPTVEVKFPELNFTTSCLEPDRPSSLQVIPEGNGTIVLTWHPSNRTNSTEFEVEVEFLATRLKDDGPSFGKTIRYEYPAQLGTNNCDMELYHPTATKHRFYVAAEHACRRSGRTEKEYQVEASSGLTEKGKLVVNGSELTLITLRVPPIATVNTVYNVVVRGPPPCGSSPVPNHLRELLNMTESDEGWLAKEFVFSSWEDSPEYLTISKATGDDNSKTCTLDRDETHVILLVTFDSIDKVAAIVNDTAHLEESRHLGTS